MRHIIDSFPVAVCNNMRILNCKILKEEKYRDYTASMRNYFMVLKCNCLPQKMEFRQHLTPGKTGDAKPLGKMIDKLQVEAFIYRVSAYQIMDYKMWHLKKDLFH